MDELSEEEHELEEMDNNIRTRGFKTIRRVKTQQEEKQETDKATPEDDEGDSAISGGLDLDANMEDLNESEEEDLDMTDV